MAKVSVIVPCLLCAYTAKTIDDIFVKATGDIEVIAVFDGWWPDPLPKDNPNLVIIHRGQQIGMRKGVNAAARVAKGKYLLKVDDHCMFGEGFDEILQKDCEEDWMVVPSRYSFEPDEWKIGRIGPSEYLYMTFPYYEDNLYGMGLHGKKWTGAEEGEGLGNKSFYKYENLYKNKKIDDIVATQGSCWFCHKDTFWKFGGLDEKHSYLIHQEPQEMAFKFWMSGGAMKINKNTWYAHWHKNQSSRIWRIYKRQAEIETERYGTWYWMNDKWPMATRKMEWLVEKFWPMPGWPVNWKEEKEKYEAEHPEFCSNFRVFDPDGIDSLPYEE